ENEPALRPDDYETRERGDRLRREEEDRRDELRKVIAEHLKAVERFRQVMEIPRERVGHGLRLVVVVQAREVAPAAITAHLDEPRAELDAECKPAEQIHDGDRRCELRVAEEEREEPGLAQQALPAERVEGLTDVHDAEVH